MSGMGKRAPELFMLGMFSMIDAILNRPLSDILSQLPISEDVKTALLGEENPLRRVYQAALAYEKGSGKSSPFCPRDSLYQHMKSPKCISSP